MIRPENVPVAVDVIVEAPDGTVLLIERKNEPHGWALPGGFLEQGESLYAAAEREVKEETGLDIIIGQQFFTFSQPDRDPRGPVVSVVFTAWVREKTEPQAGDDAGKALWLNLDETPVLAFDHEKILGLYLDWKLTGNRPDAEE